MAEHIDTAAKVGTERESVKSQQHKQHAFPKTARAAAAHRRAVVAHLVPALGDKERHAADAPVLANSARLHLRAHARARAFPRVTRGRSHPRWPYASSRSLCELHNEYY